MIELKFAGPVSLQGSANNEKGQFKTGLDFFVGDVRQLLGHTVGNWKGTLFHN